MDSFNFNYSKKYYSKQVRHIRTDVHITTQKMKFSIKDLFSICDQIRRKLTQLSVQCIYEEMAECSVFIQYMVLQEYLYANSKFQKYISSKMILNPSRPNPGRREKINLNFYFHTSLWCLKRFYQSLKGLHKTF